MDDQSSEKKNTCPGCGARFVCGAESGLQTCWCMEKPTGLFEPEAGDRCYCSACMDKRISERSAPAT